MKRLMFLLVSAFIATTSYCANVSDNIMYVLGNNDETTQIEKQKNQPLILQKAIDMVKSSLAGHCKQFHCNATRFAACYYGSSKYYHGKIT